MSSYSNEEEKIQKLTGKLKQLTLRLADVHSQGKVFGKFILSYPSPDSVEITVQDRKPNLGEPIEFSNEFANEPAEEMDLEPSQAGDIFSLGCYFYAVITGGEHPFGKSGNRILFIANNLYDLAECRDDQLRKLIAKMICHDSASRPTSSYLLDNPFLWKEDRVESYLTSLAENIDEKWKSIVLFSSDQGSCDFDMPHEISTVKSITEILTDIKEKKETALQACQIFPDLLYSVYLTENPSAVVEEIDSSLPETFGNVLIANSCFGEVQPVIGIKRRHGRFGLQHVHVMQFPCFTAESISLLRRLSCLSHQNLLRYFYLAENSAKSLVLACEPFDETLDTWMKKNSQPMKLETAKEILTHITTGLTYYHYKNIVHGNLIPSQITITCGETITAKIARFLTDESTDSPPSTKQNDVRKLGHIYKDLLERVEDVTLCSDHLLRSMAVPQDEFVPPSDAVFYHPFFWSPEEMADFLLVSADIYKDIPTIDRNSSLRVTKLLIPEVEFSELQTNRSAIEYFLSSVENSLTDEEQAKLATRLNMYYPMLVTQTWLRLQTFKTYYENFDLGSFYHPTYDFPTYLELMYYEKKTSEIPEKNINSPKDEPEGTINMEIALLDEDYSKEFVIGSFPESDQIKKKHQTPHPIERYLEKYVRKWEFAEKDNAMARKMKHPVIDSFGRTAMHLACLSDEFYEPAAKLIEFGFDPNTYDKNGFGPLHVAALNNSIKIGELLIKNAALVNKCEMHELRTPLFLAAIGNSIAMLKLLIKHDADTNGVDAFGLRPLHIAVASNGGDLSSKAALHLLKNDADVDALDGDGNTPLHIAVSMDRIEMAELLFKYKADPNIVVPGNRFGGVLHMAVAKCSLKMLNLLLKYDANPNLVNFQGETPLHLAASLQPPTEIGQQMTEMLLKFKASTIGVDHMGFSVLHAATINQAEDIVKRLLKIPNIEIDLKAKDRKVTPLHLAAWIPSEKIAGMLIEELADIDARDYNGETPLEYAAASNAVEVARMLLKAKSRRWKRRHCTTTPLHIAAAQGALQVAELLIAEGAEIEAVDEYDFTPLHYAKYRGMKLSNDKLLMSKKLSHFDWALIPELTNSLEKIAWMLIEKKANIDARDYNGETPLKYAAASNAVEVARMLLKAEAKAKSRRWKQRSPLHIAAAHGALQVAELLIAEGAEIEAVDEYGFTPLHYAEYRGHEEFIKFLNMKLSNDKPLMSKKLSPSDVALIPELTNSFQLTSIQIPSFQIKSPAFLGSNFTFKVSQRIMMYSSNPIQSA